MSTSLLPLKKTAEPVTAAEVAEEIRLAAGDKLPVYPLGGETSLNFGLAAGEPGTGLSLAKLDQVVDYPARDMTVTVGAGMRLQTLSELLANEGQQLPFDVPHAAAATVGGIVATNFNGPRRYGYGAIRDYVIGIEAVDGSGRIFHGGGRVVKNVAGYDFCKLLTGSLGTLGVITHLTFRLRPLPEATQLVLAELPKDADRQEQVLARLAQSPTHPVAIEILIGPPWQAWNIEKPSLLVRLEGTTDEVEWMSKQLQTEMMETGCDNIYLQTAPRLWSGIVDFPSDDQAPLVVIAHVVPSGVIPWLTKLRALHNDVSILAHAGQGAVVARFHSAPEMGFTKLLTHHLQPLATALQGKVTVLSHSGTIELTPQVCWSGAPAGLPMMQRVKQQFDPQNILNRGRFVFPTK